MHKSKHCCENYINEGTKVLKDLGFTIRWGQDFNIYNKIIERHQERYPSALGFRPETYASNTLDGIWLVAYRRPGELVHTQACRRMSIKPNLMHHFQNEANAYETETFKFDVEKLKICLSPDAYKIQGDAIYHGDAWLKGGPNGVRGGETLCILSRLMMARILLTWDIEYIYGLIPPAIGIKGLPQRYGYMRCEQGAITFTDQTSFPNDLWLVWMTADEARMQLQLSPKYFQEMLRPTEQAKVDKVA